MRKCGICNVYVAQEGSDYCPKCIGVFGLHPIATLAAPSPEPPRLTTNWQDPETGEVMWSGKPTWGELRDALELAGRVLTGIRDGEAIHFFQGDGDKAINTINALLARCQRRVDSPAGEETRGNGHH